MPTKPAPLLRATSHLRAMTTRLASSSVPIDIDIDSLVLPTQVEWKHIKVPAIKKTVISRPPPVLAIHLVRSMYERGLGAGRNSCEVTFEEEITVPVGGEDVERADKEEAVVDDEDRLGEEKYRLVSLVTHKGYHDNGHYICYRRRKRARRAKGRVSLSEKTAAMNIEEEREEIVDDVPLGLGLEEITPVEQVDSRTRWWEISDEFVVGVDKTDVMAKKKGVYILFYERTL